jgi:myo-inositol-1(or 4)-monophosphatase
METLLEKSVTAVKQAGKFILESEIVKEEIIQKGEANYVTQVDLKVQSFLIAKLRAIAPESNIITEESAHNRYSLEKPTWILDPVDGTTNLMRAYRHSAVSLAFFDRQKPVLGVVYNPFNDEAFTAVTGGGAFLNHQKIKVSDNRDIQDCLIAFGTTPYQREHAGKTFRITENIFRRCLEIRRSGAAALDMAYVACGRVDAFFEYSLQPWDYAAGMIILAEAGGRSTRWDGQALGVLTPGSVLATNGLIHQEMLSFMND